MVGVVGAHCALLQGSFRFRGVGGSEIATATMTRITPRITPAMGATPVRLAGGVIASSGDLLYRQRVSGPLPFLRTI